MTKFIVLFRPGTPVADTNFADRIRDRLGAIASDERITDLWMTCTTGPPPRSLLPLKKGPVACVSLCTSSDDAAIITDLGIPAIEGYVESYEADEALPVSYAGSRPEGRQTPGVCLLTLFHRKPRVDYPTFIERWHEGHTGLSLRYHPLWHYNRNVVRRVTTVPHAPAPANQPYDGIVEEHFRSRDDLLNPFRFYGRPHVILQHMATILFDILGFIDLRRIETYLTREWIIKGGRA